MKRTVSLLLTSLLLLSSLAVTGQKQLTLEDCIIGAATDLLPAHLEQAAWRNNTEFYTYIENQGMIEASSDGKIRRKLFDFLDINELLNDKGLEQITTMPDYQWLSDDELLIKTGTYFIWFNVRSMSVYRALSLPDDAENEDLSPTSQNIAFTIDNNLYVSDTLGNRNGISVNGDKNIVSGQYVSRNEFGILKGTFWSPQGNYLAYYVKDESAVSDYPLVDVTERVATLRNIKYPMAGMASEILKLGIYDVKNRTSLFLNTGVPDDHYLTNIAWSPDEKYIYMAELNRDQDHLRLNQYNAMTGEFVKTIFEETDDKYIDPLNPIVFLPGRADQFIWQSRRDGYNHFYLYDTDGNEIKQLTSGKWEVLSFSGFNKSGSAFYFTANKDGDLNEMVYRCSVNKGTTELITPEEGIHTLLLNAKRNLILDQYSSSSVPNQMQIRDGNGKIISNILTAENPLKDFEISPMEEGTVLAADGITKLHYRLFKPAEMEAGVKYPVIIYVYNGPFEQLIRNQWVTRTELWLHYMADRGYAAFILDGRGSANRGKAFEQVIYRMLGVHEMEDQLNGVEFLKSIDFVDPDRIGVFGWSYGGFMTTSLMTTYPEIFKAGVAGGPVTDWKYYEVMYGERYMDTPQANGPGFEMTSVLNKIGNLKGRLLVIQGAQDPVVVWQHSLMLLRKSVETDVLMDYFVYPTHEHNVTGVDRVHLFMKITDYFSRNL